MTVKGQTKVNLDISGSEAPLKRIDSMVNRIIAAVIIMSLIIGSSLLCLTEIRPMVGDIPLLGNAWLYISGCHRRNTGVLYDTEKEKINL